MADPIQRGSGGSGGLAFFAIPVSSCDPPGRLRTIHVKTAELLDARQFFSSGSPVTPNDVRQLRDAIAGPQAADLRRELFVQVQAAPESRSPAVWARLGIGLHFFGQHERAVECFSHAKGDAVGAFYHALSLSALGRYAEAEQQFEAAAKLGYDPIECTLRRAGAIRAQGRLDDAEAVVRSVSSAGAVRAEYSYQLGCIWADRGDRFTAIEYFERAVDMDPHHARALFRLAAENALHGNDEEAIRLYEQSLSKPPYYLGALINLGLLYEDQENYAAAAYCFRRVLEHDPNHARARLYLRDIEATSEMYYDEDMARQEARMQQLLSRPISDFELSVRSRNCLESMNISTLGDLTRVSEQELLAGKNFGETSLHEIREMLAAHGLRIGQNLHAGGIREMMFDTGHLSPQEQSLLNKPVSELNLSVRARKCMTRLNINTIGQLIQRSPDELLASRNFGVTSLNEVRSKLAELNLKLRND